MKHHLETCGRAESDESESCAEETALSVHYIIPPTALCGKRSSGSSVSHQHLYNLQSKEHTTNPLMPQGFMDSHKSQNRTLNLTFKWAGHSAKETLAEEGFKVPS